MIELGVLTARLQHFAVAAKYRAVRATPRRDVVEENGENVLRSEEDRKLSREECDGVEAIHVE